MKKTALTFGLFSLVMVATSFTTPENTYLASSDTIKILSIDGGATGRTKKLDFQDIDGGATGRTKKLDFHGTSDQASFASVNQSFGSDKKID
ncbi:hypothetical protein [Flavobacterium sp. 245]|uniref:hypothetical protein n=1 Tax=Flavobacterium sp. 245 TaxID=2512115 RepID=UPI00105D00EC|nr:hypothetical protein [Flavobacterium sp. 245]TDO98380.1 hypothetical protein EV145_10812 [Flavobacterium sp. 245]